MMKKLTLFLSVLLVLPLMLLSCASGGDTVFEYNGYKVSEKEYRYYLSTLKTDILSYHGKKDNDAFWDSEIADGKTAEEYYTAFIDGIVKDYCIAQSLFRQYGLKLDADTRKAIKEDINEKIDFSGSRAELNAELAELGINIELLTDIYTKEAKYNAVYNYLFGENGTLAATSAEVEEYYRTNYSLMQYIVLYTTELVTDEKGNPVYDSAGTLQTKELTPAALAEKRAAAENIRKASDGKEASVFEELMEESEYDTSAYPGGFYVSENEIDLYGEDICSALKEMKTGQVRVIEEAECIYVIREYDLPAFSSLDEAAIDQLAKLQSYASQEIAGELFGELEGDVTVVQEVHDRYHLREIAANRFYNY